MLNNRWRLALTFGLVFLLIFSSSAAAFQDLEDDAESAKIVSLKERGLISGVDEKHFAPDQPLSYAQGIALIVSGLHLERMDDQPEQASDVYTHVSTDAWFHEHFTTALHHLDLPTEIQPAEPMTKEQFTHLLFQAMLTTGDYVFIEPYILIADEAEITSEYMNSIQKMLITNITSLDDEHNFYPKKSITRAEAAVMLHDALTFVQKQNEQPTRPPISNPNDSVSSDDRPSDVTLPVRPEPSKEVCDDDTFKMMDQPSETVSSDSERANDSESGTISKSESQQQRATCEQHGEVYVSVSPVHDDVNKVHISWGQQPNSGYGLSIDKVEFSGTIATVHYTRHYPEPDRMYLQVITYPQATTYVDRKYELEWQDDTGDKVELPQRKDQSSSDHEGKQP